MIGTYSKKPVTVSAVEWTGNNAEEIRQFCGAAADICITVVNTLGASIFGERDALKKMEGEK